MIDDVIVHHPPRRRQLAQLGSATGVYKTLVKYLVGVPQVVFFFFLLAFVCFPLLEALLWLYLPSSHNPCWACASSPVSLAKMAVYIVPAYMITHLIPCAVIAFSTGGSLGQVVMQCR